MIASYLISKAWFSYTLFQNGRNFSIVLFPCKLALVASFKGKCSFDFEFKNETTRLNLQENKEY